MRFSVFYVAAIVNLEKGRGRFIGGCFEHESLIFFIRTILKGLSLILVTYLPL